MNPRVTLGFVAAVIILAGVVLGLQQFNVGGSGTPTPIPDTSVPVFNFNDQNVTAFQGTDNGKTTRFEKVGDNWTIAGNPSLPNTTSLTSLLAQMGSLTASADIPTPSDLAPYGLNSSTLSGTAELNDGTKHTIQFGSTSPIGTGIYATTSDSKDVFLVPATFSAAMQRLVDAPEQPPTPTPSPTSTPAPSPSGTTTPAATGTPST